MIHFDLHRAPVEVIQFIADEDGRCSYLVASGRTRVAALVDPDPAQVEAYRAKLDDGKYRLRMVLDTSSRDEAPDELWDGVPRIGPSGDSALQAGDDVLLLGGELQPTVPYTIWGSRFPPSASKRYGPIRVAFGAGHVSVVPLAAHAGRVAYHLGDRLFTGTELRSAASAELPTPEQLLSLDNQVIVYPGWVSDGAYISIVAAERRISPRVDSDAGNREPATQDVPARGLLDEEPADYWSALELGRELAAGRRWAVAAEAFEVALQFRPEDRLALQNLRRARELSDGGVR